MCVCVWKGGGANAKRMNSLSTEFSGRGHAEVMRDHRTNGRGHPQMPPYHRWVSVGQCRYGFQLQGLTVVLQIVFHRPVSTVQGVNT